MKQDYDIFISYRRKDNAIDNVPTARTFQKELTIRRYSVFFDYSDCNDGRFNEVILPAIRTCKVFLFIMTEHSLDRCLNKGDWVRRELEEAIKYKRKIVAVSPNNLVKAWKKECLPIELYEKLQYEQITGIYMDHMFESGIDYLIKNRLSHISPSGQPEFYSSTNEEDNDSVRIKWSEIWKKIIGIFIFIIFFGAMVFVAIMNSVELFDEDIRMAVTGAFFIIIVLSVVFSIIKRIGDWLKK